MKKTHIIFAVFAIMLFTLPFSSAQGKGKELFLENDQIAIKITGNENVPQYQFWRIGENKSETDKYQVKFIRLFEVVDGDGDATYTPGNETKVAGSSNALAKLSWDFSDPVTEDGMTHFNITSEGEPYTIQFRNHFDEDEMSLKFDIVIEDYEFVSDDENAMLVLQFHLISAKHEMNQVQNKVQFGGDAYFEGETEADDETGKIQVGVSSGEDEGDNAAFLSFERFTGKMVHDPVIGFDESSSSSIPGYSNVIIFAIIPVIGLLYIIQKKR